MNADGDRAAELEDQQQQGLDPGEQLGEGVHTLTFIGNQREGSSLNPAAAQRIISNIDAREKTMQYERAAA
ncbi:hypothetical protein NOR53_2519 [gamma proteobacterium NOR5-3]|nr:hypothetical protein NOR53_2519 [gamma proteobacterium NOR5-3]